MLEVMLDGILLADYVDKIIGKSYFAQKSLRLTEINAQTSHFWSVVVLLLLKTLLCRIYSPMEFMVTNTPWQMQFKEIYI